MESAFAPPSIVRLSTPTDAKPNRPLNLRYVTIHNTGNPTANAEAHGLAQQAGYFRDAKVAVHYYVDDLPRIFQNLANDEQGWHTGSADGNATSIAIETCEHNGINQAAAEKNAAWLAAHLITRYSLPLDRVVPHKFWRSPTYPEGKNCPSRILPHWDAFIAQVRSFLPPSPLPKRTRVLALGMRGEDVSALQSLLRVAGYNVGRIDGDFGIQTENAVKRFQMDTGLFVDGKVGALTWERLTGSPV